MTNRIDKTHGLTSSSHMCTVLLQHGADPNITNTDGKSALDMADSMAKSVLSGQYLTTSIFTEAAIIPSCIGIKTLPL